MLAIFRNTVRNNFCIRLVEYTFILISGWVLGITFLWGTGREVTAIFRSAVSGNCFEIWMLISGLIPIGLTFLFLYKKMRYGLPALIMIKTALFAFSATAFYLAYPTAGWLIQILLLFSSWMQFCGYQWLWMRYMVFRISPSRTDYAICAAWVLLAFLINILFICPFTAMLFIDK